MPLLSAGNWGGVALHLRGNVEGFLGAGSEHKFLEIHSGDHIVPFYSLEGRLLQERFLDQWLHDVDTGILREPRVRLAIPYGQNIGHVIWPPGGLSQPLSSWPILDQNRNKLTSARAPNAIITPGFPNACQNPCPTPDGSAHSLTPTPNRMKCTQASHK